VHPRDDYNHIWVGQGSNQITWKDAIASIEGGVWSTDGRTGPDHNGVHFFGT
jgi:hypothetical protein